ncbi:MAG: hypothetical protein GZ091_10275 [Paludibacter sp.]|nr:hypothetical protein [Paludibacter sp.]
MNTTLKILKAGNGDSLILRFLGNDNQYKNIIIDGGNKKSEYTSVLKCEVLKIKARKENIDLLILTHTDQDHVKGIQYLLNDADIDKSLIKCVWFNSFDNTSFHKSNDISYIESCDIQNKINEFDIPRINDIVINEFKPVNFFGAIITLLSPVKEDLKKLILKNSTDICSEGKDYDYTIEQLINKNSKIFKDKIEDLDTTIENRVSISMLVEVQEKSILFMGDANPDIIQDSVKKLLAIRGIDKLKVNVIKLAHHASHRSLSLSLIDLIDSNNFIISTNGKKSNLPNKLTLAKILNRESKNGEEDVFIFNYDEVVDELKISDNDYIKYNFKSLKPNYSKGYLIKL